MIARVLALIEPLLRALGSGDMRVRVRLVSLLGLACLVSAAVVAIYGGAYGNVSDAGAWALGLLSAGLALAAFT